MAAGSRSLHVREVPGLLQLRGDRVLLQPRGPETARDWRLNEDRGRIPIPLREGDEIIFAKYGGTQTRGDREQYLILNFPDIHTRVA